MAATMRSRSWRYSSGVSPDSMFSSTTTNEILFVNSKTKIGKYESNFRTVFAQQSERHRAVMVLQHLNAFDDEISVIIGHVRMKKRIEQQQQRRRRRRRRLTRYRSIVVSDCQIGVRFDLKRIVEA
jgi:hypothetical protein